ERDGGRQIRTCERCLSEELEFARIHWPRDDERDDSDAKPERVRREQPGGVPRVDGLRERDPEAHHQKPAEDVPLVCRGRGPSFNRRQVCEHRERTEEEKGNGYSSRSRFHMIE